MFREHLVSVVGKNSRLPEKYFSGHSLCQMPVIPVFRRQNKENQEFNIFLSYGPAWAVLDPITNGEPTKSN